MQVKSCKRCGALFKSDTRIYCPACQKLEDGEFRLVREYLRANKEAVLMEIVEATGVDQKKILDYIKKGRIEVQHEDFGARIQCEICGEPVSKGMLCLSCYNKLVKPLREEAPPEEEIIEPEKDNKKFRRRPGWSFDDQEHVFFRRESSKKEEEPEEEK